MRLFCGICIITFFGGAQLFTFKSTQLLYLKSIGLAAETDVWFFVLANALFGITPICATAVLGAVASWTGSAVTLFITYLVACLSTLSLILFRSRAGVAVAFGAYGFFISRVTMGRIFITENIPPQCRTEALSIYAFVLSIGSLVGPRIWLLCNRFSTEIVLSHGILLNAFTLNFFVIAGITFAMAVLAMFSHFGWKDSQRELVQLTVRQNYAKNERSRESVQSSVTI